MSMGMTSAPPVVAKDVRSWKLLAMMTGGGAIAGLLIVSAYTLTLPRIERHQGEVMQMAITEVLESPATYDTLYLHNGALVKSVPAGTDTKKLEKVYLGHDATGKRIGFHVVVITPSVVDAQRMARNIDVQRRSLSSRAVCDSRWDERVP